MTFETYISFFLLSLVFMVIPGPTVLLVVSQALTSGRRSVLPLVAGVGLGDLLAMSLSFAGIGAVLATSAFWFSLLKWAGAIYLIYLGIKSWRRPLTTDAEARATNSGRAQFLSAFLTTALNPKSIIFFIAFMPQFVVQSSPALPQFMLLGAIYLGIGMMNAAGYAVFAGRLHGLMKGPNVIKHVNRFGGSVLIGAGLLTTAAKRNQ
jgi:threonine/homoserine/homoserine lactone efflux protein